MKADKIARYALLTSLAMVMSYIESLVPLSFAVPGVKLGLANIAVVFALYSLGFPAACAVSFIRVLLVGILFGNVFSIAYSLAGALLSLLSMLLLKKSGKFGCTGVSVAGALAHNAGQIAVAALILETGRIAYYLPVLCLSGTVTGVLIGLVSGVIIGRFEMGKRK